MLGHGCDAEDEDRYGLLVLDELGTWFNSRKWQDKERLPVIDWFLHARKRHWDVFFIVQDVDSLDGQLVNALCEHLVVCHRTDRLSIPIIGPIIKSSGFTRVLPKIHIASVFYGQTKSALRVDRWWYRARDLYAGYNTAQVFRDDITIDPHTGECFDMRAPYTMLAAYYTRSVAYRQSLRDELNLLETAAKQGAGARARALFGGRIDVRLLASVVLCFSLSAYGFMRNSDKGARVDPGTTPVSSQKPVPGAIKPVLQPVMQAVTNPEKDYFQKLTDGAIVNVSSYYSDGYTIRAIMQVRKVVEGDNQPATAPSSITLDDARALGYVATVTNRLLTIAKPGYSLNLMLP